MINFQMSRDTLKLALERASKIVERRNTIPILSCVLIRADAGGLSLVASNLDQHLIQTLATDAMQPGEAMAVELAPLADFVKRAEKGAAVYIERTAPDSVRVSSGRASINIPLTCAADDFPAMPKTRPLVSVQMPWAQLAGDMARAATAVSTEETRYYLNGLLMRRRLGSGALDIVATDSHRLVWIARDVGLPEAWPDEHGTIIPRHALPALFALAGRKPGDGAVVFSLLSPVTDITPADAKLGKPNAASIAGDGWTLTTKLVDGVFPDFTRVVPPVCNDPVRVSGRALAGAAKRLAPSRGVNALVFDASDSRIDLKWKDGESGAVASDTLAAAYERADGEARGAGFNSKYLAGLADLAGAGDIMMGGQEAGAPWLVLYPDSPEMLAVLMPMRVDCAKGAALPREEARPPAFGPGFGRYADEADDQPADDVSPAAPEAPQDAPALESGADMPGDAGEALSGPDSGAGGGVGEDAAPDEMPEDEPAPIETPNPAPVAVPIGNPIPHAPTDALPDDLAATVAGLAATVAALLARLNALDTVPALGGGEAPESSPDADAPADAIRPDAEPAPDHAEILARLAAAEKDAADWQAIAEQNAARVDNLAADLVAMTAARDTWAAEAEAMSEKRQRTAGRLRKARASLKAAHADAEAWEALAGDMERKAAAALDTAAKAEDARADVVRRMARANVIAPLAGLRYVRPDAGARMIADAARIAA